MARKKNNSEETPGFPKKWAKHLSTEWMESANSYSTDEIKKKIVDCEKAISQTEKDMEADTELKVLKEQMKGLKEDLKEKSEVYNESTKGMNAQVRYMVYLLESRGEKIE